MSDLLSNGMERLSGNFKAHLNTKKAFRSVAEVVDELLDVVIQEQNKGITGSLRKPHASTPSLSNA